MTFDLNVLQSTRRWTPAEIFSGFEAFENGTPFPFGEPTETIEAFATALQVRIPDDESRPVWANGPLDAVDGYIALNIVWSAADRVTPLVRQFAAEQGFTVHDPQEDVVYYPDNTSSASNTRNGLVAKFLNRFRRE